MNWQQIEPWEYVIVAVASEYHRKFDMVELEDIKQSLYEWFAKSVKLRPMMKEISTLIRINANIDFQSISMKLVSHAMNAISSGKIITAPLIITNAKTNISEKPIKCLVNSFIVNLFHVQDITVQHECQLLLSDLPQTRGWHGDS